MRTMRWLSMVAWLGLAGCTAGDDPPLGSSGAGGELASGAGGAWAGAGGKSSGAGGADAGSPDRSSAEERDTATDSASGADVAADAAPGAEPDTSTEAGNPDAAPPRMCGGKMGLTCLGDDFCEFPAGTCGQADQLGVCTSRPPVCRDIFRPVCGCDGMTRSNDCTRQAAGIAKRADGPCP